MLKGYKKEIFLWMKKDPVFESDRVPPGNAAPQTGKIPFRIVARTAPQIYRWDPPQTKLHLWTFRKGTGGRDGPHLDFFALILVLIRVSPFIFTFFFFAMGSRKFASTCCENFMQDCRKIVLDILTFGRKNQQTAENSGRT